MEKTATLNIRINPDDKKNAETVLSRLGVPMATAIDMFIKQIALTGGIPFLISLPKAPNSVNIDMMNVGQIRNKIDEGLSDIESGRELPAREAFEQFKKGKHNEAL